MAFLEWKDSLRVGIAEIDTQHQGLVETVNRLFDAMQSRQGRRQIAETLRELAAYAKEHFATEERYMERFAYPGAEAHRLEHRAFVSRLEELNAQLQAGRVLVAAKTMDFLRDWLVTHVRGTDQQYVPFFREQGLDEGG